MNGEILENLNTVLTEFGFEKNDDGIFTRQKSKKNNRSVVIDLASFDVESLLDLLSSIVDRSEKCAMIACDLTQKDSYSNCKNTLILIKDECGEGVVVNQIEGRSKLKLEFPQGGDRIRDYLSDVDRLPVFAEYGAQFDAETASVTLNFYDIGTLEAFVMNMTQQTLEMDEKYDVLCMIRSELYAPPTYSDEKISAFLIKNQAKTIVFSDFGDKYINSDGVRAVMLYGSGCLMSVRAFMEGYNG